MTPELAILRRWIGVIRTADETAYTDYIAKTGLADYAATAGNLGSQMMYRLLDDDRSEVTVLSWWRSMETIRGFAGEDVTLARYYPEDDRFLLDRPRNVDHFRVAAGAVPAVVA